MWALDPANSRDLIAWLRPHARNRDFEVARVGEGWRSLVEECHERLAAAFPDYELLAIKQKWGVLDYQAFPRRWAEGQQRWTSQAPPLPTALAARAARDIAAATHCPSPPAPPRRTWL